MVMSRHRRARRRMQNRMKIAIEMATTPPMAPPTAGPVTELDDKNDQSWQRGDGETHRVGAGADVEELMLDVALVDVVGFASLGLKTKA